MNWSLFSPFGFPLVPPSPVPSESALELLQSLKFISCLSSVLSLFTLQASTQKSFPSGRECPGLPETVNCPLQGAPMTLHQNQTHMKSELQTPVFSYPHRIQVQPYSMVFLSIWHYE